MNNILDILKRESIERIKPHYDYDGIQDNPPSVSELSPKPQPGEVTDKKFGWFQSMVDQAIPTAEFYRISAQLAQIIDLLDKMRQTSTPIDFTHARRTTVAASSSATFQLEGLGSYGFIFIPPHVEAGDTATFFPVTISKGLSAGEILIPRYDSQQYLTMAIPHMDDITITLTNTTSADRVFTVYLSTRPIWVNNGFPGI